MVNVGKYTSPMDPMGKGCVFGGKGTKVIETSIENITLPETNSKKAPEKIDGWNTFSFPFWGPAWEFAYFQGKNFSF